MSDKSIERRLLAMQRKVLAQVIDIKNQPFNNTSASKPSEQSIDIDDLNLLFTLDPESRRHLNLINNALNRLHRNEYFRCSLCGSTLSDIRLQAHPLTDICERCEDKSARHIH